MTESGVSQLWKLCLKFLVNFQNRLIQEVFLRKESSNKKYPQWRLSPGISSQEQSPAESSWWVRVVVCKVGTSEQGTKCWILRGEKRNSTLEEPVFNVMLSWSWTWGQSEVSLSSLMSAFFQGHWVGLSSVKWNYKLHFFYWFMRNILKYCDFSSSEKYFDDSVCHPPYNSVRVYCELEGKMSSCGWVG